MSLTISEKQFKNAAKRLRENHLNDSTHAQSLQNLSQILFNKPFEEVKATLFNNENNSPSDNKVFILSYGSEKILVENDSYITGLSIGTELAITEKQLFSMAESLAFTNNTTLREITLPEILNEEYEIHEIINLAKYMGYFSEFGSIFDKFESCNTPLLMNNSTFGLDGDWIEQLESLPLDEDPKEHVIWAAEIGEPLTKFEIYISFQELCEATTQDGKTWILENENERFPITFA